MTNPMIGEVNRAIRIFSIPGIWMACQPASMTTAPIKPPIRACEELLGKPEIPGQQVPQDGAAQGSHETTVLIASAIDHLVPDRVGHRHAEDERTGKFGHRGHGQGHPR